MAYYKDLTVEQIEAFLEDMPDTNFPIRFTNKAQIREFNKAVLALYESRNIDIPMDNTHQDLENCKALASNSTKEEPKEFDESKLHPKHRDENKYRRHGR